MIPRRAISCIAVSVLAIGSVEAQLSGRERRLERREAATEAYPELQRRLQNPLARILVVPTSLEYAEGGGMIGAGQAFTVRVGPRLPIPLNDDWHLISKTELTWTWQEDIMPRSRQHGLGDLVQTFFLSPDRSLSYDVYWGLGPTFVLPTASHDLLGSERVSVGPSFGFFRQRDRLTTGVILNHLWSVAGPSSAGQVDATRIEPLIAYTFPTSTTVAVGAELTYNRVTSQWSGPLEFRLSQLTLLAERPVEWGLGFRTFPFNQTGEAEWGALFTVSLPFEAPRW